MIYKTINLREKGSFLPDITRHNQPFDNSSHFPEKAEKKHKPVHIYTIHSVHFHKFGTIPYVETPEKSLLLILPIRITPISSTRILITNLFFQKIQILSIATYHLWIFLNSLTFLISFDSTINTSPFFRFTIKLLIDLPFHFYRN